jgi:hypothetical protein
MRLRSLTTYFTLPPPRTSAARPLPPAPSRPSTVLVHCSDGWDRTPALVALATAVLDPHARTLLGLVELLECHWCGFGHRFATRCGHAAAEEHARGAWTDSQRSFVFVQFADALVQVRWWAFYLFFVVCYCSD